MTKSTAKAAPVTEPKAAKVIAKTCGEYFDAYGIGTTGCKRLPRHGGSADGSGCRGFLTIAAQHKAERPTMKRSKTAKRVTKADIEAALAAVASGDMAPSDALSLIAQSQRRSKTAAKTGKAAAAPTTYKVGESIVQFCKVVARSGFAGQVVKIAENRVTVRSKTGARKTFLMHTLQRVAAGAQAAA